MSFCLSQCCWHGTHAVTQPARLNRRQCMYQKTTVHLRASPGLQLIVCMFGWLLNVLCFCRVLCIDGHGSFIEIICVCSSNMHFVLLPVRLRGLRRRHQCMSPRRHQCMRLRRHPQWMSRPRRHHQSMRRRKGKMVMNPGSHSVFGVRCKGSVFVYMPL